MVSITRAAIAIPLLAAAVAAQATAGPYGQCGGTGYTGPSVCGSGYTCTTYNPYYAQCYPGATPVTTSTASSTKPVTTTTSSSIRTSTDTSNSSSTPSTKSTSIISTTTRTPSTTLPTGSPSGSVPTTLVSGWYWIRAVEAPNFHSYLQAKPTNAPSPAYMDSYLSAGQFNIISGQLVHYRGEGVALLYMNVEDPTDKTQRKLQTWFAETKNAYGTFVFQGDTVTWSVADINRPNNGAWLVCEDQKLFVNTGAYAYLTPAGCADETIHYYGGSTANS